MNKPDCLIFIIFILGFVPRLYPQAYSFLVAGHAYGAHAGENIGLHPPFLEKLNEQVFEDTSIFALFLTGDIVNNSNEESWQQVADELTPLPFPSYYIMGNHDDDATGKSVFIEKFGNTFYSFSFGNDLFVVLNSTLTDRSISSGQLEFLQEMLESLSVGTGRIFLFFHEVLWNSHEKYKGVMSNSRSRYAQMHLKSNFWTEVFPLFTNYPNYDFYCFSGDMGGNTDAVSLFYDKLENVSLIASGMGEVPDENFLKVNIEPDTVVVEIIPLNDVQIFPIEYYSVPARPESVFGPVIVVAGESGMFFSVDPVFNATSYRWELPPGIHGYSDVNEISLSFDQDFIKDTIRVSAIREGFGESLPARLVIGTDTSTTGIQSQKQQSYNSYRIFSGQNKIFIYPTGKNDGHVVVSLLDVSGRILLKHSLNLNADNSICLPQRNNLILIIESKQGRSVYKIWAD